MSVEQHRELFTFLAYFLMATIAGYAGLMALIGLSYLPPKKKRDEEGGQ